MKTIITITTYDNKVVETIETNLSIVDALSKNGYSNIQIIDKGFGGCRKGWLTLCDYFKFTYKDM